MERLEADVLVAGGGVGGLMAAVRAQAAGARVVVLSGTPGASNRISSLNAALGDAPEDEAPALFDDMLEAGGFVNDPRVVAQIAHRIGSEVRFLAGLGVPFHREGDRFARRQAAGSSWTRAVYSLGMVGVDIARALAARLRASAPAATFVPHGMLLDLFVRDREVAGGLAYVPRGDGSWIEVAAPCVVLATGGAGRIFGTTTNPPGSLGIGYGLAIEAGASLVDMEFVSFEPFIVAAPENVRGRDLPTTVLREGARLRNGLGEEFLDTSSAPSKDIICRAMIREVREGRGTHAGAVLYDIRGMAPEIVERYVQIGQVLRALNLRAPGAQLEVLPAQHYLMGGVRIDEHGASDVPGLFAVGEVAGGAHGAHRLAAGGGTEAVAMGAIAGESAAAYARSSRKQRDGCPASPRPDLLAIKSTSPQWAVLERIRRALDTGCGILRDRERLRESVAALDDVVGTLRSSEQIRTFIGRSATLALAIARSALLREESRGDHYRTDHPSRDDTSWLGNIVVRLDADRDVLVFAYERAGLTQRG
ncbi:FAD-binding protein [bacterium]|nr:MAG: FAD-binding protein [bacterium]